MPSKEKYTDPKLRDEVKEELKQSDKGGAPGQWSARKAQMMASEYKKRGGDYNTDKSEQDESQKNLEQWGKEDWQTKDGEGKAKQDDGTEKRYLPKKAWEQMDDDEKEETDKKKQQGSKQGKQFVGNTDEAKKKRKDVSDENDERQEEKNEDDDDDDDDDDMEDESEQEYKDDGEADEDAESDESGEEQPAKSGTKRKADSRDDKRSNGSNKASKTTSNGKSNAPKGTIGSKHMKDEEPAPRGSADRLPKKGQKIMWKAMPGLVDGEVTEVLTRTKKVDGKDVKASDTDPKIVMKSKSSGKICVHKPDACFYD
ncbi:hypothetical protein K431DRAFT_265063 [Polychaeton citri CBS 116435]|uniref:Hypervirulence associated protein TUDOR domain-containing protein n=1 Tax=Polychaeton citri CBS 116435 TaxID=1314669 RepID=A0A9P4URX3_9PEZI|nr:hypothetical protein K431DRAFT_265063 [Polychaeton citri CBS 116435]